MKEVWKTIKDYSYYEVSNKGRFRSNKSGSPKLMALITKSDGYLCINLMKNNIMKQFIAHRLVAQAFIRNPRKLPMINHKDRDRKNNHVDNLEWCDARYNISHGWKYRKKSTNITGVHIQGNSYIVRIRSNNVSLNLGSYNGKKKASSIYKKAVKILEAEGHDALVKYKQSLYNRFSSKYMGVSFDTTREKWKAYIIFKGVTILNKRFDTEIEAVRAVILKYKEVGRPLHFSHKYIRI